MTRLRRLAVAILAAWSSVYSHVATAEQSVLRLTTGDWPPFTSQDAQHGGVASQIVREAFALVDVEVELKFYPWARALKLAQSGRWDGSLVWFETPERLEEFFFSDPVAEARTHFFHLRETAFDWEEYSDLAQHRVGGTVAYSYGHSFDEAEAAGTFQTLRASSDEASLNNLLRGRIDVFPGELLVTRHQLKRLFPPDVAAMFIHHPRSIDEQSLHLMLSRDVDGMEAMVDRFKRGLDMLVTSGRYDEIVASTTAGAEAEKP